MSLQELFYSETVCKHYQSHSENNGPQKKLLLFSSLGHFLSVFLSLSLYPSHTCTQALAYKYTHAYTQAINSIIVFPEEVV